MERKSISEVIENQEIEQLTEQFWKKMLKFFKGLKALQVDDLLRSLREVVSRISEALDGAYDVIFEIGQHINRKGLKIGDRKLSREEEVQVLKLLKDARSYIEGDKVDIKKFLESLNKLVDYLEDLLFGKEVEIEKPSREREIPRGKKIRPSVPEPFESPYEYVYMTHELEKEFNVLKEVLEKINRRLRNVEEKSK